MQKQVYIFKLIPIVACRKAINNEFYNLGKIDSILMHIIFLLIGVVLQIKNQQKNTHLKTIAVSWGTFRLDIFDLGSRSPHRRSGGSH